MTDLHLCATPRGINVRVNIKQRRSCTAVQLGLLLKNPLLTLNTDASVRGQNVHKVFPSICFSTEAGEGGTYYCIPIFVLFFISHLFQDGTALWNCARHGAFLASVRVTVRRPNLTLFWIYLRLHVGLFHLFNSLFLSCTPTCLPAYSPGSAPRPLMRQG